MFNICKSYSFFKAFLAVILFFSLISFDAQASHPSPITPKLWQELSKENIQDLKQIDKLIEDRKYDEALKLAKSFDKDKELAEGEIIKRPNHYQALVNIIFWRRFTDQVSNTNVSKAQFNDLSRFINDNEFFPNIADLRRAAEKLAIEDEVPYRSSEQYFKSNPALTAQSKIYLLKTKYDYLLRLEGNDSERKKIASEIQTLILDIWVNENFSLAEEQNFLNKYSNQLNELNHIDRINRLLWDNKILDAKRILNMVSDDYQKLFTAIIEIKADPKSIDKIVSSVPKFLRNNENLTFSRITWNKKNDNLDEAIDLISEVESTRYPDKWWSTRRLYSREMLKKKKYKLAFLIASRHGLSPKSVDYWEAEWMSGWIALRFMDKPKLAYGRFENLYNNVTQAVTLARGAYWLGMAAEANGDKQKAIEWYKLSAKYPLFFYGQLAIHKHRKLDSVNAASDIILPKDPDITVGDVKKISASQTAQIAYLLALMNDNAAATKIFEYSVNKSTSDGQIAVIMRIINEIGDRQMDAKIARVAARKNVFFIKDKFQIVKEVAGDEYAPLVHAIIKQESGFAPTALSSVGAIGFMQLMPDTAKKVAKDMKIPYNRVKLSKDIKYNVKLGSHYIKQLIDEFDGSEMMAIASYNAGPNATRRWVKEFYDPRKEKDLDKVVDWIELITYSETRNYVQRIMENLIVYKYLMSRSNYDAIK